MSERTDRFETHIDIKENDQTAITILAAQTGLSRQKIKQVMQKGAVWLTHNIHTQRLRRASKKLIRGDVLHCYYDESVLDQAPATAQLIADEGNYSVWYKPYGMLSQGSKWGDHTTIYRYAEQHLEPQRTAFIVHRLDRAATGLILLAHKKTIAAAFAELFRQRALEKEYRVIVHGTFPAETQSIRADIEGRPATSHATLLDFDVKNNRSLLKVKIDTGRKHQIRRHLSGLGFPVVGDRLYGDTSDTEDLQLTACYLSFVSPVDNEVKEYRLNEELCPNI